MIKYQKAGYRLVHGSGSNEKHLTGKSKRFSAYDYKHFPHSVQCKYCGSDYMQFSVDGYCQRCQQRCEYAIRELNGRAACQGRVKR